MIPQHLFLDHDTPEAQWETYGLSARGIVERVRGGSVKNTLFLFCICVKYKYLHKMIYVMFDILYVPKFLKPSLIKTLGPMILTEDPIYQNHQGFTKNQSNIEILKTPLHEGDSLIVTLEGIEGYPKLCVKTYPRTEYWKGNENGQNALNLFKNRSGMEELQKKQADSPLSFGLFR
jgi:hypothetical protein